MGYNKTVWVDGENKYDIKTQADAVINSDIKLVYKGSTGTPLSAANQNKQENAIADIYNGLHNYGASATGTDAYEISFSTPFTDFPKIINVLVDVTNNGASTIKIDSLAVKNIKILTLSGKANTTTGDIPAGYIAILVYDGTDYILTNPYIPASTWYTASNNTILIANAEYVTNTTTYTTYKQFKISRPGKVRVKGQYKCDSSGTAYVQIYNVTRGQVISSSASTTSTVYVNFSIDTNDGLIQQGDIIAVQIKGDGGHYLRSNNVTVNADISEVLNTVIQD